MTTATGWNESEIGAIAGLNQSPSGAGGLIRLLGGVRSRTHWAPLHCVTASRGFYIVRVGGRPPRPRPYCITKANLTVRGIASAPMSATPLWSCSQPRQRPDLTRQMPDTGVPTETSPHPRSSRVGCGGSARQSPSGLIRLKYHRGNAPNRAFALSGPVAPHDW